VTDATANTAVFTRFPDVIRNIDFNKFEFLETFDVFRNLSTEADPVNCIFMGVPNRFVPHRGGDAAPTETGPL